MTKDPQGRLQDQILEVLAHETAALARLLRLAHRQRRYLIRGDARRCQRTVAETDAAMQAAHEYSQQRRRLMQQWGLQGRTGAAALQNLVESADDAHREALRSAVDALGTMAARLSRKNLEVHQIAQFNADLTSEELRILVGAQPSAGGVYTSDGATVDRELAGALDGRA